MLCMTTTTTTTKMTKIPEIKSPFLRLFLAFYGNFSLYLVSKTSKTHKNYHIFSLRQLYHLLLVLFFNWVCEHPNSIHEQLMSEAEYFGKPLARLSYRLFDIVYRIFFALIVLYCLRFGPEAVQILDQLHLLSENREKKAKFIFGLLLLADHAFFYVAYQESLYSAFKSYSTPSFSWSLLNLLTQYLVLGQAAIFSRLLVYGKWATWKSLKLKNISRKKVLHLFELNQRLGRLSSLPLTIELTQFTLNTLWNLCFTRHKMKLIRVFFLVLPLLNPIAVHFYSKRSVQILNNLSKRQKVKYTEQNQLIYWRQVEEIYGEGFYLSIFSMITIDAAFTLHFVLFITSYALLINQTS